MQRNLGTSLRKSGKETNNYLTNTAMEILIERRWKKPAYTIGVMSVDGARLCETLEDTDRGLKSSMPLGEIQKRKIKGQTAIPAGRYQVLMTYSPKFKKNMPLINAVPGYSGVRIHPGNDASATEGCVLVGENKAVGKVLNSRHWFNILLEKIKAAINAGQKVWLTIR